MHFPAIFDEKNFIFRLDSTNFSECVWYNNLSLKTLQSVLTVLNARFYALRNG